ncbi:kinetoplast ribosomal PPR repeat [Trypanosoma vivax]|nr:kinetoplast ribosomal PPR repeat [Trypanosoma vivax]
MFFRRRVSTLALGSLPAIMDHALTAQRRRADIPPVETITCATTAASPVKEAPSRFGVKNEERCVYNHGITPDARTFIAEAEEHYKLSSDFLHAPPGGLPAPELRVDDDGTTVACTAAPVGEEYVPSSRERFAHRGKVGELSMQRTVERKYLLNVHSELNIRKERQLRELLASPMPLLQKAEEVQRLLLSDFYLQRLTVSARNAEAVAAIWAQCSIEQRLSKHTQSPRKGQKKFDSETVADNSLAEWDDVPFLPPLKRLYMHIRQTHVAPTSLFLEYMMTTLAAVLVPNSHTFHLANRLLLDADKYVVLPTRTTYAAFFTICALHNAMPFAVARYKDAVVNLHISVDSTMVAALLEGLVQNGLVEEAVLLLARLKHVPLDVHLLNRSLEVLLLSKQPQAAFSAFEAVKASPVRPTAETYTLLLLACERSGLWCQTTAILSDMQTRRVKGDAKTLNMLLKGLLMERLNDYARQLYETMVCNKVEVWAALECHMNSRKARTEHATRKPVSRTS